MLLSSQTVIRYKKRAVQIATLATLKNGCSKNKIVEKLLRNHDGGNWHRPTLSFLYLQYTPFQPLNLSTLGKFHPQTFYLTHPMPSSFSQMARRLKCHYPNKPTWNRRKETSVLAFPLWHIRNRSTRHLHCSQNDQQATLPTTWFKCFHLFRFQIAIPSYRVHKGNHLDHYQRPETSLPSCKFLRSWLLLSSGTRRNSRKRYCRPRLWTISYSHHVNNWSVTWKMQRIIIHSYFS